MIRIVANYREYKQFAASPQAQHRLPKLHTQFGQESTAKHPRIIWFIHRVRTGGVRHA
jgi:hypothetical protein